MIQSRLLASVAQLQHGFLANQTPGGRDELDSLAPQISTVNQVHGPLLLWTDRVEKRERNADALATRTAGLAVGVYSADCAPILVAALGEGDRPMAVMAVHGGWRGTAQQIAASAFREFSRVPDALRFVATIGPCISYASFEVGEEVVQAFPGSLERGLARFLRQDGEKKKYLFDLPGENARQLAEAAAQQKVALSVEALPLCTFQRKESFPSYRRDGARAGRLLSYIRFEG